jgi:prepilin-type N-terminal cleavage/methylation domain-containing protein
MAILLNKKLHAMTLVEMLVAMAILVIVMAAVVPQLRCVQNSWAYKQSSSEILQNGRVLIDHITSNLTQAARITAVSDSTTDNGFIEYLDNDGNAMRYDLKANGYVEFGAIGSLSELAGPAKKLRFACYDINSIATTDPNRIRMVNIATVIEDAADHQAFKSFTTIAFIRAGVSAQPKPVIFDTVSGKDPALCAIDANHHLCAYEGSGSNGYAVVLGTDTAAATVKRLSSYEFDASMGKTPALARIDAMHYLCAYEGTRGGYAVILQVNPSTWAISKGTTLTYDTPSGTEPVLSQIDATHYLCVYSANGDKGCAIILTVNVGAGTITNGTAFKFDNFKCCNPALARIDAAHYLCVYRGKTENGYAGILVPNVAAGTVSQSVSFEFDSSNCDYPALAQIDSTRYLCTYTGTSNGGLAVILTVGLTPPSIARSAPYEFAAQNGRQPSLIKIDSSRYLCTYQTNNSRGQADVLFADAVAGAVCTESVLTFDINRCIGNAISAADGPWFLCAYEGLGSSGYAVMINTDLHILP